MTLLRTEALTKRFGGLTALRAVSFSVEARELVGIIGPNGAGKTTLFNVLTGFQRPDQGRSVLNDAPIAGLAPHQIVDRGLARTFQIARPFGDMTVLENVATACVCPRARRMSHGRGASERALAALAKVGLEGKAALPVHALPFGDLRRVEIARAMATCPEVLLLDEPFAGLGAFEIAPLADLIRYLSAHGVTILIVEHKLRELLRLVTRVIAMHFGEIVTQGTPEAVARDPKVVEAYLGGGT